MKRFILAFISILMLATLVFGADITINFEWNRSTETDMANYKLYRTDGTRENLDTIAHPATGTTVSHTQVVTVADATEGTMLFVVTALDTSGNESGDSNTVSRPFDYQAPAAPTGLKFP